MLNFVKSKGLTLVELMISLTLGIIVLGGGIQIFISGQQTYNEAQRFIRLQSDLSMINDLISFDVRAATSLTITSNQLTVITLPDPIIYKINSGKLEREVIGESNVVAENVSELFFTCIPNCSDPLGLRVSLTLEGGGRVDFTVGMRNMILSKKFDS